MRTRKTSENPHPFGDLMRLWRARRGHSQLDLALEMGVSQRHISFIESGRSTPSRALLMQAARVLDVPLRDRNAMLLAAGYAPIYDESAWDAPQMHSINRALERMLAQHEPFPALVLDRHWNVLMRNQGAAQFFGMFVDLAARPVPPNLLHLMFDPAGMRPHVANWRGVAQGLFDRIRRESVGDVIDDKTRELLTALRAYPDVPDAGPPAAGLSDSTPVIPIGFVLGEQVLNYFSMVCTVGTPRAAAAQELRIECMFPADEATEQWHLESLGGRGVCIDGTRPAPAPRRAS